MPKLAGSLCTATLPCIGLLCVMLLTAACRWSCNSAPYLCRQSLVQGCHCISHIALHSTVAP